MLIVIPVTGSFLLFMFFLGRATSPREKRFEWVNALMLIASLLGIFIVLISEVLTLFNAVNRLWLSITWAAFCAVALTAAWKSGNHIRAWRKLRNLKLGFDRFEVIALSLMGSIAAVLFLIAVISPPNNIDSFLYHMSRVVNWAQNESLKHYPAYRDHQLNKPIWAESAILHVRVLWGNDRLSNLVQWSSMIGSVIGVAGIAGLLGASRRGQLLSAIFALSIPMGILQTTSTQNDYVTAFWVVAMAYFLVLSARRDLSRVEFIGLASTFGLGILTKGVFFVYFPPLLAWYFLNNLRKSGLLKTTLQGFAVIGIAVVLNLGFWARNIKTYGGPYGTSDWLQANLGFDVDFLNQLFEADGERDNSGALKHDRRVNIMMRSTMYADIPSGNLVAGRSSTSYGVQGSRAQFFESIASYLRQLVRTLGRNFTNPSEFITNQLIRLVEFFPAVFGEDYGVELKASAWNHEDHAGNLHHLLLVLLMLPLSWVVFIRKQTWLPMIYGLAALATYLLLPIVIGHAESFWGVRYQLPFFVLVAPLFGWVVSSFKREWLNIALAGGLLLAALPWLLLNNTRPIIGLPPWPTKIESIFVADQAEILMANNPALRDDYSLVADAILTAECREVGLIVDQSFLEYPLWWFLDAPQSGIQVRNIATSSYNYPDLPESFQPCAVICTNCEGVENPRSLAEKQQYDTLTLFSP